MFVCVGGHLGCFRILTTVRNAAMNWGISCLLEILTSVVLDTLHGHAHTQSVGNPVDYPLLVNGYPAGGSSKGEDSDTTREAADLGVNIFSCSLPPTI